VKYYPVFIDLRGKSVVVIGGGRVAERKVRTLLKCGAIVRVVSPELAPGLRRLVQNGSVRHTERRYRKGDVKGAFLVVAASSARDVNARVAADAPYLVNVTDVPEEGNFIVPSTVTSGQLAIAISTGGASPAVARAVRKELSRSYDADFARYLRLIESLRRKAIQKISDRKARTRFLREIASEEYLGMLRSDGLETVQERLTALFDRRSGQRSAT
jgi:precorrin-2 dehydrogenase/sirohydrochlorin ferrochelatase